MEAKVLGLGSTPLRSSHADRATSRGHEGVTSPSSTKSSKKVALERWASSHYRNRWPIYESSSFSRQLLGICVKRRRQPCTSESRVSPIADDMREDECR